MKKKRKYSVLMIFMVFFSLFLPSFASDDESPLVNRHWAQPAIQNAVKNGLLDKDHEIFPDVPFTRWEMADMLVRAYGAYTKADLSSYSDIAAGSPEEEIMAKAVQMKAFKGDGGRLYPNSPITREEACVVLSRLLCLGVLDDSSLDRFSDRDKISPWARHSVSAMVNAGYINGDGGRLNPAAPMTKGEAAQLMDNIFKVYINEPGVYTSVPEGTVMINVSGVTLKGATVHGMIIVGDGVGEGECTLQDVRATGITMVRGGGPHTTVVGVTAAEGTQDTVVHLSDSVGMFPVGSAGGVVILNQPNTSIVTNVIAPPPPPAMRPPSLIALSGGTVGGTYNAITVAPPPPLPQMEVPTPMQPQSPSPAPQSSPLIVQGQAQQMNMLSPNSHVILAPGGNIGSVNIESSAPNSQIMVQSGGSVSQVTANAPAAISGAGTVGNVTANSNNVVVDTPGTMVAAMPGVTGVTAGGIPVMPGTSVPTASTPATPGNSPGGGNPVRPPVLSSNADLTALLVDGVLVPEFSSDITAYEMIVPSHVESVSVTAQAVETTVKIMVNDADVPNNTASDSIGIVAGNNDIFVSVLAQDRTTEKIYHIKLTRLYGPISATARLLEEGNVTVVSILMNEAMTGSEGDPKAFILSCTSLLKEIHPNQVEIEGQTVRLYFPQLTITQNDNAKISYAPTEENDLAGDFPVSAFNNLPVVILSDNASQ